MHTLNLSVKRKLDSQYLSDNPLSNPEVVEQAIKSMQDLIACMRSGKAISSKYEINKLKNMLIGPLLRENPALLRQVWSYTKVAVPVTCKYCLHGSTSLNRVCSFCLGTGVYIPLDSKLITLCLDTGRVRTLWRFPGDKVKEILGQYRSYTGEESKEYHGTIRPPEGQAEALDFLYWILLRSRL